jgi:hypothetical protein
MAGGAAQHDTQAAQSRYREVLALSTAFDTKDGYTIELISEKGDTYTAARLVYDIDDSTAYGSYVPMLLKFSKSAKVKSLKPEYKVRITNGKHQLTLESITISDISRNAMQLRSTDKIANITRATKAFLKKTKHGG